MSGLTPGVQTSEYRLAELLIRLGLAAIGLAIVLAVGAAFAFPQVAPYIIGALAILLAGGGVWLVVSAFGHYAAARGAVKASAAVPPPKPVALVPGAI